MGTSTQRPWAILFVTLAALLWSTNIVAGKFLSDDIPPVALSLLRQGVCFVVLLPITLAHLGRIAGVVAQRWPIIAILGLTGFAAPQVLTYAALHTTQSINMGIVNSAAPIMVMLIAWMMAQMRSSLREGIGISLSLLGTLFIVAHGAPAALLTLDLVPGDLLAVGAVLCLSIYTVVLMTRPVDIPPAALLGMASGAAVLMLLPAAAFEAAVSGPWTMTPRLMLFIIYMGIGPSALAFGCWNRGLRDLPVAMAGQAIHLIPMFTTVLAIIALDEPLRAYHVAAFGLIILGIGIANGTAGDGGRAT